MNAKKICISVFFAIFLLPTVRAQSDGYVLANIDYSLENSQLELFSIAAMEGDPGAAEKLSDYYNFSKKRPRKSFYWAVVGAENGSPEMQFRLFQMLAGSKRIDEQRRALFWLKKSSDNGHKVAKAIYSFCSSLTSRLADVDRSPCFGPGSDH